MRYIVDCQVVLARAADGPLADHLKSFAGSLRMNGYSRGSIQRQVLLASCFSTWLKQRRIRLRGITLAHAKRYLEYRWRRVQRHGGDVAALRHLIETLRRAGVVPGEKRSVAPLAPVEQCTQAYAQYLRETRGLAKTTVVNYVPFVRAFLKGRFGKGRVTLSRLSACDVVKFVQREAPRLHQKRAKLMTTALRSFLRYARFLGEIRLDLGGAIPPVANWSMPSIPRAISASQVRQLLHSIDRRTAMGRRDYAVILLLARLGLRSSEVAFLELNDIEWGAGLLRVRGKTGQLSELPIPDEVGKAIAAYLRCGRPDSSSRRVFLRVKAPIRGFMGAGGVGSIVKHSLERAGVEAPTYGTHQFRHGLATEMLRKGASLAEIGEVLGHCHPETTKIYTKVDIKALRTLAMPWPGGAR